jgi:hypothetical protein
LCQSEEEIFLRRNEKRCLRGEGNRCLIIAPRDTRFARFADKAGRVSGVGAREKFEACPLDRAPCSLIVWFLEVSFFDLFLSLFWADEGGRRKAELSSCENVVGEDFFSDALGSLGFGEGRSKSKENGEATGRQRRVDELGESFEKTEMV